MNIQDQKIGDALILSAAQLLFDSLGGDDFIKASRCMLLDVGVRGGTFSLSFKFATDIANKVGASYLTVTYSDTDKCSLIFLNINNYPFSIVKKISIPNLRQRFTDLTGLSTGAV